jgi:ABC-type arginine transport system permease subunit
MERIPRQTGWRGLLVQSIADCAHGHGRVRPQLSSSDGYTTVLRGIPDLLAIYLFYFGAALW